MVSVIGGGGFIQMVRVVIYINTNIDFRNLKRMLILIFAIHFLQAQFNQAQLSCCLNSCIIFYFILLSMAQAHAIYGGN